MANLAQLRLQPSVSDRENDLQILNPIITAYALIKGGINTLQDELDDCSVRDDAELHDVIRDHRLLAKQLCRALASLNNDINDARTGVSLQDASITVHNLAIKMQLVFGLLDKGYRFGEDIQTYVGLASTIIHECHKHAANVPPFDTGSPNVHELFVGFLSELSRPLWEELD